MATSGIAKIQRTWKNKRSSANLAVQDDIHLPGLRQKGPGGMGNQRFIGIHEAAKRRGWTHTWLRSNQPLSSVLTPFSVPPSPSNPNSSYPVQLLLLCPPSFKDPLHLVVQCPLWVPSFSHAVIPLGFSSPLHWNISCPLKNQAFSRHSPVFLLACDFTFTCSAHEKLHWSVGCSVRKK